jgi:hypothetical protein
MKIKLKIKNQAVLAGLLFAWKDAQDQDNVKLDFNQFVHNILAESLMRKGYITRKQENRL